MTDQPSPDDDNADDYALAFTPVPGRTRTDGWTPERQRKFILALRETGSIGTAARSVGKTPQSAYKLRNRPGAAGFAAAWDRALGDARAGAFDAAMERILHGYPEARFYRGRYVGMVHRYDNRLMMAALRSISDRAPAKGDK